ncbi:MAG: Mevalonate kinase [Candidatus Methanohalarchaeum thermophilum]|uniref:Mevalonate kinase n=1 Tax=Methanohalarchaeum thermophilum TaxID=1903181 RepID=A0A1Q6DRW9_METT1|nr:MAG: Mevalonate kinase [Candidatus Methanohalarchaeum thermophilum]
MITTTAPGKVYLFGEHAVVYNQPAMASAINKRIKIELEERSDKEILIHPNDLSFKEISFEYSEDGFKLKNKLKRSFPSLEYIKTAIDLIKREIRDNSGFEINITSELPPAGGLGSSAALTVSLIAALNKFYGLNFDKREIANKSYKIEKEVQGGASPCDTFTSAMGGITKVIPGETLTKKEKMDLPIVVGSTRQESSTSKLVKKVKKLKIENSEIIDPLIDDIGKITLKGEKALENRKLRKVGQLMDINQGILDALNVSNLKLSELIYSTRKVGAWGSKLTGAGGGGCMVALGDRKEEIKNAIKVRDGEVIADQITAKGVEVR